MSTQTFSAELIDQLSQAKLESNFGDKWTRFPGAIGAFIAEMDYGTPEAVKTAITDAVSSDRLGYLSARHVDLLARGTADYLAAEHHWQVAPERVRPLADIVQAFQILLHHFVPGDAPVIVPTPAYMPFLSIPKLLGYPVVEVPMLQKESSWEYDFEEIENAFAAGAKTLILCNPHNPIGKVATREELHTIANIVERHNGLVFADEIHSSLVLSSSSHIAYASISDAAAQHTITATSASKAFNIPGAKCAQLILTGDSHFETWKRIGTWYEHQTSTLGIFATVAAYAEGRDWLKGALEYVKENLRVASDFLTTNMGDVKFNEPDATYLLWLDFRETVFFQENEQNLAEALRTATGVAVTDGRDCGEAGRGFLRFNLAMPRPILIQSLKQIQSIFA